MIPGVDEIGAYVAAIYPGGIADQLHGELREGTSCNYVNNWFLFHRQVPVLVGRFLLCLTSN